VRVIALNFQQLVLAAFVDRRDIHPTIRQANDFTLREWLLKMYRRSNWICRKQRAVTFANSRQ
jgi:hypothetical protein